jgi:transcriptional regulator with XRE-family HTH domain
MNDCIHPQQGQRGDTDATDRHIGACLRNERFAAGVTQQELAAYLGITYQQMQKHETGISAIPASRLYRLSQALAVPVSFFFDVPSANESADLKSREGMRLVRAFRRIDDPEKRLRLLDLVKALAIPECF